MTCEEGEFENEEGAPAPEFDCVVDLESGDVKDVVLSNAHSSTDFQTLQAEASLFSAPLSGPQDSSSLRRSSRSTVSKTSPPLLAEEGIASGLSRPPVGS